jgi:hypothetical protein
VALCYDNCMSKQRLSVTVDAHLIEAVETAVSQKRADSISAWVNAAIYARFAQERRLEALSAFIADYEAEHGEITDEEMRLASRRARASAMTIRGPKGHKRHGQRRQRSKR